jgi:nicotinamide mononucleotide transporter
MDWIDIFEALALVFNLAYVALAVYENIWCWPSGFVGAVFTLIVFFDARLYGAMGLQVVFASLMVYGWYEWRHGGDEGGRLAVTKTPMRWRFILLFAGTAFAVAFGLFLRFQTDAALPFWDAGTTSFSLVAQFMTTRKWIGNWLLWIVVDSVFVGMFVSQQLYFFTVLYIFYIILAVMGFVKWQQSLEVLSSPETA